VIPLSDPVVVDYDYVSENPQESISTCITSDETVAYSAHRIGGLRLYDINLNNIPWAKDYDGSNWVLMFDDSGNPTPYTNMVYGVKTKANFFGPGWGAGGYAYGITPAMIPSLSVALSNGQVPLIQLFENDGTPILPVRCAVPEDFAAIDDHIRLADWDFLSNGNLVAMGESRQAAENAARFGVPADQAGNVNFLSILKPDEQFPTVLFTRLSETATKSESWHGIGVTQNGFAVRFSEPNNGGSKLRFFENNGTPLTGDIDLASLGTGETVGVLGGQGSIRGDEQGWHGNGVDRYILVSRDYIGVMTGSAPFVGIFDVNGNLIVGPVHVTGGPDGWSTVTCERIDGAIHPDGRFIVCWTENSFLGFEGGILMGRIFNADGTPATKMFSMDSAFDVNAMIQDGHNRRSRIVWRGNKIAVAWVSTNRASTQQCTVRTFTFGEEAVSDFMLY